MKYKTFKLFIILFCHSVIVFSQTANNWYFGANAGLNFNINPPASLIGGLTNGPDNTTSISDASGNLLFYTNGITVWNKNHIAMPNGSGLIGHISAGQCAIIVPIPCNTSKYVIFHVTEYSSPGYLNYSVVDMSLNSGLGDVVTGQKNISLGTGWTEKLCAYYNPNGKYYWLLSHKWMSDQFVAFKIDAATIATQSVVSSVGSVNGCGSYGGTHDAMGQLTISPDGSKIVNALTCLDSYELFDFNVNTGSLSNLILIPGNVGNAWGTAFSPDSKKLYTNGLFSQSVFQYDLNTYNQSAIVASKFNLYTSGIGGYNFGYMELGPDNKLYIAKPGAANLTIVNNPNNLGGACNFSLMGPSVSPNSSTHGLSRIAYNIPLNSGNPSVSISISNPILCLGQTTSMTANGASTYTWNTNFVGSVMAVTPTINTTYTVTGSVDGCFGNAAITVSVTECTGIDQFARTDKEWKFYPNPIMDKLFVEIVEEQKPNCNLYIVNTLGQIVFSTYELSVLAKIDLSFLSNGVYFIHFQNGNKKEVQKMIKS
jgi:hypothetical protein